MIESRRLSLWNSKVVHIPSKSLIASRYVAFLVFASSCYNNWCVMEINKWGTIGIVLDWFGRFNWKILTCCYPVLPFWNPKSGKIWKFRKAQFKKKSGEKYEVSSRIFDQVWLILTRFVYPPLPLHSPNLTIKSPWSFTDANINFITLFQ